MNDAQLDLLNSENRRDSGIARATVHAEDAAAGWNRDAYRLLMEFVLIRQQDFLSEDFVAYCKGKISDPPDGRAWGGPIQAAAKKRLIVRVGYAPANSSNRSPKCLWRGAE